MPEHHPELPTLGSDFESAAHSPGLALWQVTNRWQGAMRSTLKPHDLTHVQYVLLAALVWIQSHTDEPITQADLAEFAATDRMMTSQVLRALEAKQLLQRDHHPRDGRARALHATPAGVASAQRATRDIEAADREFFAPLGAHTSPFVAQLALLVASPAARGDAAG